MRTEIDITDDDGASGRFPDCSMVSDNGDILLQLGGETTIRMTNAQWFVLLQKGCKWMNEIGGEHVFYLDGDEEMNALHKCQEAVRLCIESVPMNPKILHQIEQLAGLGVVA